MTLSQAGTSCAQACKVVFILPIDQILKLLTHDQHHKQRRQPYELENRCHRLAFNKHEQRCKETRATSKLPKELTIRLTYTNSLLTSRLPTHHHHEETIVLNQAHSFPLNHHIVHSSQTLPSHIFLFLSIVLQSLSISLLGSVGLESSTFSSSSIASSASSSSPFTVHMSLSQCPVCLSI